MDLSSFICEQLPTILAEWTSFASKVDPDGVTLSTPALTDHAGEILLAIAADINTRQSPQQQYRKSQGDADTSYDARTEETAAAIHGRLRHASNFSLLQLSSEFRALRATVLRLWLPQLTQMSARTVDDMVRFNEAIDQALAESIVTYSAREDRTRDLFLAILGHDLRAPLATISLVADVLIKQAGDADPVGLLALKSKRNAMLMSAMVTDLLGFTRLQMGAGMPAALRAVNAGDVCDSAASDARAMYPSSTIVVHRDGELKGQFDSARLQQLVTNLLINATQHSRADTDVLLEVSGSAEAIDIKVTNFGPVIPADSLEAIFQPLVQLDPNLETDAQSKTSLGLGLFIAREAATVHHATITVTSSEAEGTVFLAHFPHTSR